MDPIIFEKYLYDMYSPFQGLFHTSTCKSALTAAFVLNDQLARRKTKTFKVFKSKCHIFTTTRGEGECLLADPNYLINVSNRLLH